MGFFLAVHRSIVDPQFYKEIRFFSRAQILMFFLKLLLLTSLISTTAQWYFLIYSQRGISQHIENLFKGMEIKNGILDPKMATPIVPPTYLVMAAFDQISGVQNLFSSDKDSMVIIDTAKTRNYVMKLPAFLLERDKVVFFANKQTALEFPYKALLFGANDLLFTTEGVNKLLKKNSFKIFSSVFIANSFQSAMSLGFSIIFLAIAAFFFRMEKGTTFGSYLRASIYSITPMAVGEALIAISGVKMLWSWHILIFISTIVLFRGLVAAFGNNVTPDDSGVK